MMLYWSTMLLWKPHAVTCMLHSAPCYIEAPCCSGNHMQAVTCMLHSEFRNWRLWSPISMSEISLRATQCSTKECLTEMSDWMWDFGLGCWQHCCCSCMSSRMWCCVVGRGVTSILKDHGTFITEGQAFLWPWRWRHCDLLKQWKPFIPNTASHPKRLESPNNWTVLQEWLYSVFRRFS